MAITTENTFLCTWAGTTTPTGYTKLVDIKEFPDLGKAPNTVDVTTLTDHQRMYLLGLKDPGILEFTCNYDATDYATLAALSGEQKLAVVFGTLGSENAVTATNGAFYFKGLLTNWVKGAGVEAPVDMGVAIAVSTEIKKA